jgi:hypothetical protein
MDYTSCIPIEIWTCIIVGYLPTWPLLNLMRSSKYFRHHKQMIDIVKQRKKIKRATMCRGIDRIYKNGPPFYTLKQIAYQDAHLSGKWSQRVFHKVVGYNITNIFTMPHSTPARSKLTNRLISSSHHKIPREMKFTNRMKSHRWTRRIKWHDERLRRSLTSPNARKCAKFKRSLNY